MRQHYWFKARKQGIGWVPSTWQGWAVLFIYLGALVYSFILIDNKSHSASDTIIAFFPKVLLITAILTVITYFKGEPTSWRGKRN